MSGDAVKIYFCDICNESIPLRDLELGSAITIKGKVICHRCNPQSGAGKPLTAAVPQGMSASGSSSGWAGMLAVVGLLAGGAALALFFLQKETHKREIAMLQGDIKVAVQGVQLKLDNLEKERQAAVAELEQFEKKLRNELQNDLARERTSGENRDSLLKERIEFLQESVRQAEHLRNRMEQFEAWKGATVQSLMAIKGDLDSFNQEIRTVKEATAKISAGEVGRAAVPGGAAPGIPIPGWEEILKRLKDADPGVRWNAVIDLGQTGDPRAIPHLVPLLKDEDVFVRNNVAITLGDLDARNAVSELIDALADSEQVVRDSAYTVLKRLTKQTIKFDPFGRKDERERGIAAWREWWTANKAKFLGG